LSDDVDGLGCRIGRAGCGCRVGMLGRGVRVVRGTERGLGLRDSVLRYVC